MPRRKNNAARLASSKADGPAPVEKDVEAQAVVARQRRVVECERMVQMALRPILDKYRCRLGTMQEIMDGQPAPIRIIVIAND